MDNVFPASLPFVFRGKLGKWYVELSSRHKMESNVEDSFDEAERTVLVKARCTLFSVTEGRGTERGMKHTR